MLQRWTALPYSTHGGTTAGAHLIGAVATAWYVLPLTAALTISTGLPSVMSLTCSPTVTLLRDHVKVLPQQPTLTFRLYRRA